MSKKIYAIMDVREANDRAWVTEPIIVDNDVQASMAYADFQKQLIRNHVKIDDLRIYRIGYFDNDDADKPIVCEPIPIEIAVNLKGDDDEQHF